MGFPTYQPRQRQTPMRISDYPRYAGTPIGRAVAPPVVDPTVQDFAPPVEQPGTMPATRPRWVAPSYQPLTPEDLAAEMTRSEASPLDTSPGSAASSVDYAPLQHDAETGQAINGQTRSRIARPGEFAAERYEDAMLEAPRSDGNGRVKSALKTAGLRALSGLARGGVGGAIAGSLYGAVEGGMRPETDERLGQQRELAEDAARAGEFSRMEKDKLDREDQRAGIGVKRAQEDYYRTTKKEQAAATENARRQRLVIQNLGLRRGQKLDPINNPKDAELLRRAALVGISVDPDEWNNAAGNLVAVTVVDPNNPTQTRRAFFNKATQEIVADAGQTGYVQPVGDDGMTAAQRAAMEDRRKEAEARQGRFDKVFSLGLERFGEQVRRGMTADAQKIFNVQTDGLFQQLNAVHARIKDYETRAAENKMPPEVAKERTAALQAEALSLGEEIESARARALGGMTAGGRVAAPGANRAPAAGGGAYSGQRIPRANLKTAAQRLGVSEAEAERVIRSQGGTVY